MRRDIFFVAFIFFLLNTFNLWAGKRDPFVSLESSILKIETPLVEENEKEISKILSGINLEGVLYSPHTPYVIINEKVLKEGESIGKVVIKKILPHKVVFKYGKREVELKLDVPSFKKMILKR